jgi:hypothetical protein
VLPSHREREERWLFGRTRSGGGGSWGPKSDLRREACYDTSKANKGRLDAWEFYCVKVGRDCFSKGAWDFEDR